MLHKCFINNKFDFTTKSPKAVYPFNRKQSGQLVYRMDN